MADPLADIDLVEQACEVAKKFVDVYYKNMDKTRHLVGKLYTDTATLVWNGNSVSGQEAILKFYEALPASDHSVQALDSHPIASFATGSQPTIVVTVGGSVSYTGNREKLFNQTFILTSQLNQPWKIISDNVRTTG